MPKRNDIKKVLIIGSGPIIIGQAAEFDYAGTQACKAIKEEGIETILVNSNPATIMTDKGIADKVYMEPLTEEALTQILEKERPDGILAGFGGQTALNLAMQLDEKGILSNLGVELLGVNKDSIKKAEDRDEFKQLMQKIGEPIPPSIIATTLQECRDFVEKEGFPVIIRPAYTLGGTGGGIATNAKELEMISKKGMESSSIGQILLEKSVAGWKEIEFEVMRDRKDNCIIICSMENLDPVGVHTGDSIVVAPVQTLRDVEYQMLRNAALKIIRSLNIEGGCNIQYALDPHSMDYIVIEVNPRVSRSSALASKAAGYPIAKIAAKIAIGFSLDELNNYVTKTTSACFEPTIDYCVVKFPKWPFDKFRTASRKLGTQMKATGEVMSIDRTFESALLKAVTSLEVKCDGLRVPYVTGLTTEKLMKKIEDCDDERIFCLAEAMRRGKTVEELNRMTQIDPWFLDKLMGIVEMENELKTREIDAKFLAEVEKRGFTDSEILALSGMPREALQDMRIYHDIFPVYKVVDTCGGEFDAATPYYYSCFDSEDESVVTDKKKILVVGSGPIRIGQGIEFDYCCVQGVWAIKELGYEAIIINNNPETVSTDFDTSDKLYFEALHIDDVMNVVKKERPQGVILQFGGQTSLNLADKLSGRSIKILGTSNKYIDIAEDREKFIALLEELQIPYPAGTAVTNEEEAFNAVEILGYPVVVRPSFVIGGRGMQVVYEDDELKKYLKEAVAISTDHPILIDKYIEGQEIEIDAIGDGEEILIPGIMEHIERTGVHSGDSISVYPPFRVSKGLEAQLVDYTERIAKALHIVGLVNIQYAWDGEKLYVIEVNPRASRTVPILSKVTRVPMINLAVAAMLGQKLKDLGYGTGLYPAADKYSVKVPVFSSAKLTDVDVALGPEMRSTGEVLGIDEDLDKALYKGFLAANMKIPASGGVFVALRDSEKTEKTAEVIRKYQDAGFTLYSSKGTTAFLHENGIEGRMISFEKAREMVGDGIDCVINVPRVGNIRESDGFATRRKAIEWGVPVLTCMDTADAFMTAIRLKQAGTVLDYKQLEL